MTSVLKFLKLDFYTFKSQYLSMIGSLSIILFIFIVMLDSSFALLCCTAAWFAVLLISSIFVIQEKNSLERLYSSISIKCNQVVLGRYLFIYCNYFMLFFMSCIVYFLLSLFQGNALTWDDMVLAFSLSFASFNLIIGMQVPMYFWMGYTKSRFGAIIPYMAVLALMMLPSFLMGIDVIELVGRLQNVLMGGGVLVSLVVLYISYRLSVIAYRKYREGENVRNVCG